jgi:redox-sensitive bicupin YhaK (pirin superfamily)
MKVPPHPHTGLQTVSWLLDGEVLHLDSLGSEHTLRPGQLGLMTAGRAIARSEQSPSEHAPLLHGAQLWVALPGGARPVDPHFEFHADLPVLEDGGLRATVIMGELAGARSQGKTYSPVAGVDVELTAGADRLLPLEPDLEYAMLTADGVAEVDGVELAPGSLLYLGCGRSDLCPGVHPKPDAAPRRGTVRRENRDVVELCGPHERRGGGRTGRVDDRRRLRHRARVSGR